MTAAIRGLHGKRAGGFRLGRFRRRKAGISSPRQLRGIGLSTYVEACGLAPSRMAIRIGARGGLYESATVRVHPTGDVTVLIGTHYHGQGHETTFRADRLGEAGYSGRPDRHRVRRYRQGSVRHGHLRLAITGGRRIGAVQSHRQDHSQGEQDRRSSLGARGRHRVRAGVFNVAGTDRPQLRRDLPAAYVPADFPLEVLEPGLEEQAFYDPVNFTYPGGAHIAEVESIRKPAAVSCCPILRLTMSAP